MENGRRLGRGVESRIVVAATHDALVSARATIEAIARVSSLVAAGLECMLRRVRADPHSNNTLPNKVAHQDALGAIGEGRKGP
jgi:hypothetical protein